MENYKQLNTELITQVQGLKTNIAAYQKELVYLRSLVFDERNQRLQQEQSILILLAQSFAHVVKHINPDVDILNLLSKELRQCKTLNDNGDVGITSQNSSDERRSSEIVEDFRRSVAVQRGCKSLTETVSPVKRFSVGIDRNTDTEAPMFTMEMYQELHAEEELNEADEEECECEEGYDGRQDQLDEAVHETESSGNTDVSNGDETDGEAETEMDNTDITSLEKSILAISLGCISEKDEERLSSTNAQIDKSDAQMNTENSAMMRISPISNCSPLSDVTNVSEICLLDDSASTLPTPHIETRRGKFRDRIQHSEGSEGVVCTFDVSDKSRKFCRLTHSSRNSLHNSGQVHESNTSDIANLNVSELILRDNIKLVPSSTPYGIVPKRLHDSTQRVSMEITLIAKGDDRSSQFKTEHSTDDRPSESMQIIDPSEDDENTPLRPRRRCKPTNLAEPNLRHKIRNENESGRKSSKRTKKGICK